MPKDMGKHKRLRRRLREHDIDQLYLGVLIGRSQSYVSSRMARGDWLMSEVYKIAEVCQIPVTEIYLYFPPGGDDNAVTADGINGTSMASAQAFVSAFADFLRDTLKTEQASARERR